MSDIEGIKVKWHPKTLKNISQIPKDGIEFAHVSEDYTKVHQLVWCKDFIQDAIFGTLSKSKVEIYGFEYNPETDPPVSLDKTRIMISNWRDLDFEQKLLNNCKEFLHDLEDRMQIETKTVFKKCINPPAIYRKSGVFILESSPEWIIAPPMVSIYTLMIRIGMIHTLGESSINTLVKLKNKKLTPINWKPDTKSKYGIRHVDNDSDFLSNGWTGLSEILRVGHKKVFGDSIKDNYIPQIAESSKNPRIVSVIHNSCGLSGFSKKNAKKYFPQWHSNEEVLS